MLTLLEDSLLAQSELARFGLGVLDKALGGGLPRGTILLLEEDTGTKPDALVAHFIAEGLRNDEFCYILNTEHPPRMIMKMLASYAIDVQRYVNLGKLFLIDGFTDAFGWGEFQSDVKHVIHNIRNIKEVHDVIRFVVSSVKPKNNLRGVVDSLSTLLLSSQDERAVFNYIHHQMAAQKNYGNTLIYVLHKGAHKPETVKALEHIVDGVIEIRRVEQKYDSKSVLQIQKLREMRYSTKQYWYQVDAKGVAMKPRI